MPAILQVPEENGYIITLNSVIYFLMADILTNVLATAFNA
jgi:hypothetical protein